MAIRCFARRWVVPPRHSGSARRAYASVAEPSSTPSPSHVSAEVNSVGDGSSTSKKESSASSDKGKQVPGRDGASALASSGVDMGARTRRRGGQGRVPSSSSSSSDGFFFSRRFGQSNPNASEVGQVGARKSADSNAKIARDVREQIKEARRQGTSSLPRNLNRVSAQHPLIKELMTELYISTSRPSAEKIWRIYMDIHQYQQQQQQQEAQGQQQQQPFAQSEGQPAPSSSSTRSRQSIDPALLLHAEHHQMVLRAIAPDVVRARREKRQDHRLRVQNKAAEQLIASHQQQQREHLTQGEEEVIEQSYQDQESLVNVVKPSLVRKRRFSPTRAESRANPSIRTYLERVGFIFVQLRNLAIDDESASLLSGTASPSTLTLPAASDYNHVIKKLAPTGHMPVLAALWSRLSGQANVTLQDVYDDEADAGRERKRHWSSKIFGLGSSADGGHWTGGELGHQAPDFGPTAATYKYMMLGISRHLNESIERAAKEQVRRNIKQGKGKARKWKVASSAKAAARGMGKYGEKPPEQAKRAVQLASKRAALLLDDMRKRGVPMERVTLDMAARLMRLSGNVDGIKALLRVAHDYDLRYPDAVTSVVDSSAASTAPVSEHTLNTLLMALGEQATVAEMIVAYETLTRPLPTGQRLRDDDDDDDYVQTPDIAKPESWTPSSSSSDGSLFATDFRSLFKKDEDAQGTSDDSAVVKTDEGQQGEGQLPDVMPYPRHLGVAPNTFTLKTMIKHTTTVPDPTRMVAAPMTMSQARRVKRVAVAGGRGGDRYRADELIEQARLLRLDHEARRDGTYLPLASYLVSEAVDWTEREVVRMAQELGVAMPDVAAMQRELAGSVEAVLHGARLVEEEEEEAPLNLEDQQQQQQQEQKVEEQAEELETGSQAIVASSAEVEAAPLLASAEEKSFAESTEAVTPPTPMEESVESPLLNASETVEEIESPIDSTEDPVSGMAEEGDTVQLSHTAMRGMLRSRDPIDDVYSHLMAFVSENTRSDTSPLPGSSSEEEADVSSASEEATFNTNSTSSSTTFVPQFEAPRVELTFEMVQSVLLAAWRRKSGGTLRTIRDEVQRALALQLAQLHVLGDALNTWSSVLAAAEAKDQKAIGPLTRENLKTLVDALEVQERYTRTTTRRLLEAYWTKVEGRLFNMAARRRKLSKRRKEKKVGEIREEERRMERERLEREEERLRLESITLQQEHQQQSDVEQREPKAAPVPV